MIIVQNLVISLQIYQTESSSVNNKEIIVIFHSHYIIVSRTTIKINQQAFSLYLSLSLFFSLSLSLIKIYFMYLQYTNTNPCEQTLSHNVSIITAMCDLLMNSWTNVTDFFQMKTNFYTISKTSFLVRLTEIYLMH